MKQKIDEPYLLHIKDAIEAIEIFIHGKTLDDFKKDDYFQKDDCDRNPLGTNCCGKK